MRSRAAILLPYGIAAVSLAMLAVHLSSKPPEGVIPYQLATIDVCVASRIRTLGGKVDNAEFLERIGDRCYVDIRNQGLLNDFQMRRGKFLYQDYANYVVLWMVVAITLSGVMLAGLQLAASYKLAVSHGAALGGEGELTFRKTGDVALKSSVTGLFILLISFAFFLVFVIRVYEIREVSVDPRPTAALPMGGYGPAK